MVWRHGNLFVCVDFSLVVTTDCGTVCMEACMVWGQGALSTCVDFLLVSTTGGCTELVIVVASTVNTMGWAVTSVCVPVSTDKISGFVGGFVGRLKG